MTKTKTKFKKNLKNKNKYLLNYKKMLFQLFIANLTISFLLALFVYTNSKIYYKPCKLIDKNGNVIDIHKIFDIFHPHDELSFWKLWLGGFLNFQLN